MNIDDKMFYESLISNWEWLGKASSDAMWEFVKNYEIKQN